MIETKNIHYIHMSILLCMYPNIHPCDSTHKAVTTTNPPAVLQDVLILAHDEQSSSEEEEERASQVDHITTRLEQRCGSDEYIPYIVCATGTCSLCGLGAMALIFHYCL